MKHVIRRSLITAYISRYTALILVTACLGGLLLGFGPPALAQDDVSFTASVDHTSINTNGLVTLELTLSGAFRTSIPPQLPPLEGFAVVRTSQSSQFRMVNSQFSSEVVFIYQLKPTQVGSLAIPPIPIRVGQRTYQTEPIVIEVAQGAAPQASQPTAQARATSSAPAELTGRHLYIEASVDNPTPVVGEQIIYHFRFYQAIQILGQPRLGWPDFTGFLGYDLSPNNQYYEEVSGQQYLVTEVRRVLFPAAQGRVTIAPATLTIPGDFFNRTIELQTSPVIVEVRPPPEGVLEDFGGAVGRFEIEAWVEPAESRVNEPVTLFVRVAGLGNVGALPDPTEETEAALLGWRVYDSQVTTDVGQDGDTIRGERLWERLLVPKIEGELTIPSFGLAFFDPTTAAYERVQTAPLVVRVAPGETQAPGPFVVADGKHNVVVLSSDIRHINPAPPSLVTSRRSLFARPLYWAGWAIPPLALIATWLWDRRRRYLEHDVAYARAQRARRLARRRLSEARKLVKTNEDAAYASIAHAITSYLGDKFNLPAAGLTRDAIRQRLAAHSISGHLPDHLLACLDWADLGRFAPVAAGRDARDLAREAEQIIAEIEGRMTR